MACNEQPASRDGLRHLPARSVQIATLAKNRLATHPSYFTLLCVRTARIAKKPKPPKLFWLTHRHPVRTAGVVAIESALVGGDRLLEFPSGPQLELTPANLIGSFLDDGNLRKTLIRKKPPARQCDGGRRVGLANHDPPPCVSGLAHRDVMRAISRNSHGRGRITGRSLVVIACANPALPFPARGGGQGRG